MVKITGIYEGEKHCELTHGPSLYKIETDAPKDNFGRGEAFSPTDLAAAALGSCMMTVMGIYAEKSHIVLTGSRFSVEKHMKQNPRMIAELIVQLDLPKSLSEMERETLEDIALNCPVKLSLHPDIKLSITFNYTI